MGIDLKQPDSFVNRHLGPDAEEIQQMLKTLRLGSLEELVDRAVPKSIRFKGRLRLPEPLTEYELISQLREIASANQLYRSFIGMGYSGCITPPVILRNVLQNPGWYTAYTPYQAEIAQGRLEALLNFQTMVIDLTGLELANASLLDEATAAAEALHLIQQVKISQGAFFVSEDCHPQTIAVVKTRAEPLGIGILVGDAARFDFSSVFGALLQYPTSDGGVLDYRSICDRVHGAGGLVAVAADLLSLVMLTPPGEFGADVVLGNTQRFGVPLGYGGPHAAYFATKAAYARHLPGRIIGVSEDAQGSPALRMALQTREQHIRREKATSNICTAQVLLAVVASMYAVYHGPKGLKAIAERIHALAVLMARGLIRLGYPPKHDRFFDTVRIESTPERVRDVLQAARSARINLRKLDDRSIGISLDETVTPAEVEKIWNVFALGKRIDFSISDLAQKEIPPFEPPFARRSAFLTHPVFNTHHSETEMLRYIKRLEARDLSLAQAMIPLGSCTMKLNATAEMVPITWPEFADIHPFVPLEQTQGYQALFRQLETFLEEITGLPAVSLQPNAGSQGEYAGLLVIRAYHESRKQGHRNVCLIPSSAHGTNPASAALAGYRVVVVQCDLHGNVELGDLQAKAEQHHDELAALMITYPSTHGVFEEDVEQICDVVHQHGGQVYMDGANMNAQVGLCRPAEIGADVCHLNLHKTFCIPHGGGGPGMGPIAVASHLAPFLPSHPVIKTGGAQAIGAVSAAPWGSPSILPISWAYIAMMGSQGLTLATEVAILNANYIAKRLENDYPVLYRGKNGMVAHECILDMRHLKRSAGIEVEDVAKRLMDYGFHAPTVSFPVAGTMMVEPTESESKAELDRFCDAMIAIRNEIREIETGAAPRDNNLLKNAPHTARVVVASDWNRPYSRERAAFPTAWSRQFKFWPAVGRLNNVLGDRNLMCSCPPVESYLDGSVAAAKESKSGSAA